MLRLLAALIICCCTFANTASAITIINKNSQPVHYAIYAFQHPCVSGYLMKTDDRITWTTSETNPNCNNPQFVEVHVEGATSTTGVVCTPSAGDKNPLLINMGTEVTVKSAGFGKGVKCYSHF